MMNQWGSQMENDLISLWFNAIGRAANYQTMVYYAGSGISTYEFNFSGGYINQSDIKTFMVNDKTRERIDLTYTWVNSNTINLSQVVPVGWTVCIYRDTPKSMPLAKFVDGAIINANNLDRNAKQAVFAVSEMVDRFDSTVASVESALVQVYEANQKSDAAVATANSAAGRANTAITTANGAVTTANSASDRADKAINTANTAISTSEGAVQTANNAKAIADGLNAQIISANKTADEAKEIAQGIDAKATEALSKATAAVATANQAQATAEGIDAKATKAMQDAAEALLAVNVAKGLTDRVASLPGTTDIFWKGAHQFIGSIRIAKSGTVGNPVNFSTLATEEVTGGTRTSLSTRRADDPTGAFIEHTNTTTENTLRVNADLRVDPKYTLYVPGKVVAGNFQADSISSTGLVQTSYVMKSTGMHLAAPDRNMITFENAAGTIDGYLYKDKGGPVVLQHNTGSQLRFEQNGNLSFTGGPANCSVTGLHNLNFNAGPDGTRYDHWMRRAANPDQQDWNFGIGNLVLMTLRNKSVGGNEAYFQNDVRLDGALRAGRGITGDSIYANDGSKQSAFYADGNIQGNLWQGNLWDWLQNNVKNRAVMDVGRSGPMQHKLDGVWVWEAPDGHFLTGFAARPADGNIGYVTWVTRALMKYNDGVGWRQIGSLG